MQIKLWQKLAMTIVLISMIIVAVASLLSLQSFTKGFLAYLNELEKPEIEKIKVRLLHDYQQNGNWDFLEFHPHRWHRYLQEGTRTPRRRRRDKFRRPPPPPVFFEEERERGDSNPRRNERFRPPPPSTQPALSKMGSRNNLLTNDSGRMPEHLALLDNNLALIVGEIKINNPLFNHSLQLNQKIIGYLHVEPFIKLTEDLDRRFIQNQRQSVIKIAMLAFFFSIIGAWVLAYYLRKRLMPLVSISRDFTEHNYRSRIKVKQKDELGQLAQDLNLLGRTLEKNQIARQQWIADISHELRTPLSILNAELEAIEDGIRPLNQQSIQSLSNEMLRLKKLVEDLFQLSLSDLGALQYSWEKVNLKALIVDVAENFQMRFAEKSLFLSHQFEKNNNYLITGDRNRLYQLLSNLLENSYRYTDQGGQVQINCYFLNKNVIISIDDSFPSVPSDQLVKMFDRLHRIEKSRNRKTGGAGLGLGIIKTIIEAHEGNIHAELSSLGGLKVLIKLPIAQIT